MSQKNFANRNDENYTSFLTSHELEVAFEEITKLPTLFIFSVLCLSFIYFPYLSISYIFVLYIYLYCILHNVFCSTH